VTKHLSFALNKLSKVTLKLFDNSLIIFQLHLDPYLPKIILYRMEVLKNSFLKLSSIDYQIRINTEFN
jgi:hypothetical protein